MRIKVKANFVIKGINNEGVEFEGHPSLRDVLFEVANKAELPFMCPDKELDPEIEILLNGLEYAFLPKKLDTKLKEDDEVEIMMLAIGGG